MKASPYVAVRGASDPDPGLPVLAREVGGSLAEAGAVVLRGTIVGILPVRTAMTGLRARG